MAYNKLKGRIIEKFGSQVEFAKALGVTETTVSRKMQNKSEFDKDDMEKWSALLDIEKSQFYDYFFADRI